MTVVGLVLIGLTAGALATALGIGGGVVFVPALVVLLGFSQHLAEGTSLAVIVPTTLIGTWVHHRHGRIEWRTALTVGGFGILGGVAGSRLALSLDADVLRRMFAVLLIIVAARLLQQVAKRS